MADTQYAKYSGFGGGGAAPATGDLTDDGTDGIVITNGTGAVLGSGTQIAQHVADASHNGYLSLTDWNTFNSKQAAGNYITALTGDGTASGPGSAALTLATVNSNVGSFGGATSVSAITVNAKGLVTAAASTAIQIAESQVTDLVSDLAGKQATGNYITALTGDATAAGPGSVALTLATVNSNVGSFGSATEVAALTVNAKGLVTAAASTAIQIAESQVTNLVSDLAGKQASGNYITALTGDAAAAGPGSAALTLATVNSNVGSFGGAAQVGTFTVNGKGLITAASNTSIALAASAITSGTLATARGGTNLDTSGSTGLAKVAAGTWSVATLVNADVSASAAIAASKIAFTPPTVQKFTSGSDNYTTPAGATHIRVRMIGGGGGGGGSATGATNGNTGGTGGTSTFGSQLSCVGGSGGTGTSQPGGGAGGTATLGTGPIGTALSGGAGMGGVATGAITGFFAIGGGGGNGFLGGAGKALIAAAGVAGATNTGAGGGGGSSGTGGGQGGGGGGAGGFVDAIIVPTASEVFAYTVGGAGTAGTAGTSGFAGGAGAAGYIEVTEYYN